MKKKKTVAIILAGGQSQRFGSDKALASLGKSVKPILHHLSEKLSQMGLEPYVSVSKLGKYSRMGFKEIGDEFPHCGPLGGVATALRCLEAKNYLFLACDMPLIKKESLEKLISLSEGSGSCVFTFLNWLQPFPCVLSRKILPVVEEQISKNKYSMKTFFEVCREVKKINLDEEKIFTNMNTPDDYKAICRDFI